MMPKCYWCHDLGFAISERADGIQELQKCDSCDMYASDEEAADLARAWLRTLAAVARARASDELIIFGRRILVKDNGAL